MPRKNGLETHLFGCLCYDYTSLTAQLTDRFLSGGESAGRAHDFATIHKKDGPKTMEITQLGTFQETSNLDTTIRFTEFGEQLEILKALGSETRLKIVTVLHEHKYDEPERGLDISTLASILGQTEANISAQVKKLEKAGLIKVDYKPGGHGVRKICQVDFNKIEFILG